jgi:DNA uptake protein ComE-like DNA-binding protein
MRIAFCRKPAVVVLSMLIATSGTLLSRPQQTPALVDLNTATKQQLMTLEGVTAELAEAIASSRPYQSVQELVIRKIVNPAIYEKIKTKVKVLPTKKTFPKQAPVKAPFGTGPGEK